MTRPYSWAALQLGLPESQRPAAARLYWQAFGGKLGRVLGPEPRALAYLARVMRPGQAISALDGEGRLLGLAGFRTAEGGFASGSAQDLVAVYGRLGALWRGALMARLSDDLDETRFLLDGICVAEGARNQGLGEALIHAICAEARLRGYGAVRLDVVEGNTRAIALYERLGFRIISRQGIGPLRLVFGFRGALTMMRAI